MATGRNLEGRLPACLLRARACERDCEPPSVTDCSILSFSLVGVVTQRARLMASGSSVARGSLGDWRTRRAGPNLPRHWKSLRFAVGEPEPGAGRLRPFGGRDA